MLGGGVNYKHWLSAVISTVLVSFAVVGLPLRAHAAPVLFNFGAADFAGPTPGTVSQFEVADASGLKATIGTDDLLYWDNYDELGRPDGFGVVGPGHDNDEFEKPERLWVQFNKTVTVLAFGMTDLYNENEPSTTCDPTKDSSAELSLCYLEEFELRFNGSSPWFTFSANPDQYRVVTNGEKQVVINAGFVDLMEFTTPGSIIVPGFGSQGHEASLRWILVEEQVDPPGGYPVVPEPTSLVLLGTGLAGVVWRRKRHQV